MSHKEDLMRSISLIGILAFLLSSGLNAQQHREPDAGDLARQSPSRSLEPGPAFIQMPKSITGLAFQTPALTTGEVITVEVLRRDRVVAREQIAPLQINSEDIFQFLGNHSQQLDMIKDLDKIRPGTLRFRVSTVRGVLTDVPFTEAQHSSRELVQVHGTAAGQSLQVDIYIVEPRRMRADGMEPDPQCLERCDLEAWECYYEICDQRGDCSHCYEEDLDNCRASCPNVCVDPKSITIVYGSTDHYLPGGDYVNTVCKIPENREYLIRGQVWYRDKIQRTTYCNGTFSDIVIGQERRDRRCKQGGTLPCSGLSQFSWSKALPPECFNYQPGYNP